MSRSGDMTAVNCTSCGAGLELLGGGRVQVHFCSYCGSELDAQDDYKVLAEYADLERPETPLSIGDSGQISGVDYTVIGILELTETYAGRTWRWVDHQIYSPTHGYAWLTFEDGHFIFTRRVRMDRWISEREVETASAPPGIMIGDERFRYYETTNSKVTFAEGEFTWRPKIGDERVAVSALSDASMVTFAEDSSEREAERSVYVPSDEVAQSFRVEVPSGDRRTHPLEPYKAGPDQLFLRNTAAIFAVICILLSVFLNIRSGAVALNRTEFTVESLPQMVTMDIGSTIGLSELRFQGVSGQNLAFLGVEIQNPDGSQLLSGTRNVSYRQTGSDSNPTLRFRPRETGQHRVVLTNVSTTGTSTSQTGTIAISASTGRSTGDWLRLLGIGFGIFAVYHLVRRLNYSRKRWSGSDWSSD